MTTPFEVLKLRLGAVPAQAAIDDLAAAGFTIVSGLGMQQATTPLRPALVTLLGDARVLKARDFAIRAHGDQKYGKEPGPVRPYAEHLHAVVQVVVDTGPREPKHVMAAWLHDVVEDTPVQIAEVRELFGDEVAGIVWACSGFGANRAERNADIHAKLQRYPGAKVVKCADRIANLEDIPVNAPRLAGMYDKEGDSFLALMEGGDVPPAMLARLARATTAVRVYRGRLTGAH